MSHSIKKVSKKSLPSVNKNKGIESSESPKVSKAKKRQLDQEVAVNSEENEQEEFDINDFVITKDFLRTCRKEFDLKPENLLARNTLSLVGIIGAASNLDEINSMNHIFSFSLKGKDDIATNQENSGRCATYSYLNTCRRWISKILKMKNFEFSATYIFFYDKLERANYFLTKVLETLDDHDDDVKELFEKPISDGAFYGNIKSIVGKWGLSPKAAMPETYHSGDSEAMNYILVDFLQRIGYKMRNSRSSIEDKIQMKKDSLKQVYEICVKFLGKPPEKFDLVYVDIEDKPQKLTGLNPADLLRLATLDMDIDDFVVLGNYPFKPYYKRFQIYDSQLMVDGSPEIFLNLPIRYLLAAAESSIRGYFPVWMAADINRGLCPLKFAFHSKMQATELLFGKMPDLTKAERLIAQNTSPNHAMCILGFDEDKEGNITKWQIENSWGFLDANISGRDGFFSASSHWLEENVFQIVVHKKFLSENILKHLDSPPIILNKNDPISSSIRLQ